MKTALLCLLAALSALPAPAQEALTPQRMSDRLFLFRDIRADLLAQAKYLTAAAPMERRLTLRNQFISEVSQLDFAERRTTFAKALLAELKPEEIARLYRYHLENSMLISGKLAKVRAESIPLQAAFAIHVTTGIDGLGDFAIEHPPTGEAAKRVELLLEFGAKHAAKTDDSEEMEDLSSFGISKEDSRALQAYWNARMSIARVHAVAKHLDEREIRQFLTPRFEPSLARLLQIEENLFNQITSETANKILLKIGTKQGK